MEKKATQPKNTGQSFVVPVSVPPVQEEEDEKKVVSSKTSNSQLEQTMALVFHNSKQLQLVRTAFEVDTKSPEYHRYLTSLFRLAPTDVTLFADTLTNTFGSILAVMESPKMLILLERVLAMFHQFCVDRESRTAISISCNGNVYSNDVVFRSAKPLPPTPLPLVKVQEQDGKTRGGVKNVKSKMGAADLIDGIIRHAEASSQTNTGLEVDMKEIRGELAKRSLVDLTVIHELRNMLFRAELSDSRDVADVIKHLPKDCTRDMRTLVKMMNTFSPTAELSVRVYVLEIVYGWPSSKTQRFIKELGLKYKGVDGDTVCRWDEVHRILVEFVGRELMLE